MSKKKQPKFVEFALCNEPRPAQWSFRNYFDEDYNDKHLVVSKQNGVEKQAVIKFPPNTRIIRIPSGKKDVNGNSYAEYIRNSPFCKGSALCSDDNRAVFYEINPVKDAKVKLEEDKIRVQATAYALEVKGEKLEQLANYVGCFHEDEDVQRSFVMEYAKLKPREFNEISDSPSMPVLALYGIAESVGVIQKKGFLCEAVLEDNTIPLGNKNSAIEKLSTDKGLYSAVERAVALKKAK